MRVWIVMYGRYEDISVDRVFSSRESAEAFILNAKGEADRKRRARPPYWIFEDAGHEVSE